MAGKRANGEGTIYQRKDGRWVAAATIVTMSGINKRIERYGRTREEARMKRDATLAAAQTGIPVPDRKVKLADYIDYWLEQVVKTNQRPKTYEQYELSSRLYLKPGLGKRAIGDLTIPSLQAFFTGLLAEGHSVRTVQVARTTLSAVLTNAQREELVNRNVARLVKLPQYIPKEITPWSIAEARQFLAAAAENRLYPAFALLLFYGLRRGEVLGLRWCDIDFDKGVLHIRQQLQRVGRTLAFGPVKTKAGQRDLPLLPKIAEGMQAHQQRQANARGRLNEWRGSGDDQELVFTTSVGSPIEPRNFVRSFWGICNASDLRVIKLHHLRHTTATLLKDLRVPARDAQLILGHASQWTTEQIYQHADLASRVEALTKVEGAFAQVIAGDGEPNETRRDCQSNCQTPTFVEKITLVLSGGPGGARTHDTLLKRHGNLDIQERLRSVGSLMEVRARAWKFGVVTVNLTVKNQSLISDGGMIGLPPGSKPTPVEVALGKIGLA